MTNEPGQAEKPQITSGNKEQLIIINSPDSMPNPLNDNGIWVPHREALNPQGKTIIASWKWEKDARKVPILDDKLEKLEEEKIKNDPSYYERRRFAFMSSNEKEKYNERKMLIGELGRLKNNEKPVPLSREIIERALNIDDEELNKVKNEIAQLRKARKSIPRQAIKRSFWGNANAGIISESMDKRDEQKEKNYQEAKRLVEESKHEQV